MIARIWQGQTRPGMGSSYVDYLRETGLREYAGAAGFRGVLVLRRPVGSEAEFVLITLWDDLQAVRGFAGPEPERAVYYPDDDVYFPEQERRPYVKHYEVLGDGQNCCASVDSARASVEAMPPESTWLTRSK